MNIMKKTTIKSFICTSALLLSFSSLANVAVIVNSANNAAVDEADISRIFLGKVKSFSTGETITLINLDASQATRGEFEEKVLNKSASQVKAYWSKLIFSGKGKPPEELATDKDILAFVAANPGAIGYVAEASLDGSVKVVKVY